jgi:pimeloyl-ACP methyl ester carboxylesterase
LHGGGLSWWSWQEIVDLLKENYHVVTPVLDGYGEAAEETFISIEESAQQLIHYIEENQNGKVFAIGGLSIGAQIVVEALSMRSDLCKHAIIESALIHPIPRTKLLTVPACKLSYGLIQKRWFSKLQAKELCVPEKMFDRYYEDSIKVSSQSLVNTILSNGTYQWKPSISQTKAKVLIIVGEKEVALVRKSAQDLYEAIEGSELYVASGMKHGEFSLGYSKKYVDLLKWLFKDKKEKKSSK